MSICIPVPPVHEQHEIAEQLVHETSLLDSAIERAKRQIDLIREYRASLIADVVTGKLDVREAVTRLLKETRDPGGWDKNDIVDSKRIINADFSDLIEQEENQ